MFVYILVGTCSTCTATALYCAVVVPTVVIRVEASKKRRLAVELLETEDDGRAAFDPIYHYYLHMLRANQAYFEARLWRHANNRDILADERRDVYAEINTPEELEYGSEPLLTPHEFDDMVDDGLRPYDYFNLIPHHDRSKNSI